ncbi:hypothetical protein PCS_00613 [Desulfocurvibacter africanus PCS]|uniref:TrfA protein n=1 Tax=Desulfocurvibacter africanus PCS TaxID=1262666 RepID=M5PXE6_DESAF|nr:hypothetical protein [Desulfocurvibacter africanus]EMG38972.1 hypothetical protein PCS_00613 [Desulfocurvibacter africanus PCS]
MLFSDYLDDGHLDPRLEGPLTQDPLGSCGPRPGERQALCHKASFFLASNLFAPVYARQRKIIPSQPLRMASSTKTVVFCGEQLDQSDLDVLLLLLAKAQATGSAPGRGFRVHVGELASGRARRTTPGSPDRLLDCLFRLEAGRIAVRAGRFSFSMQLLSKFLYDHEMQEFVVYFDKNVQCSFMVGSLQRFVRERLSLGRDPLAKWLHALAWSLEEPLCFTEPMLQELSGRIKGQRRGSARRFAPRLEQLADLETMKVERLDSDRILLSRA